MERHNTAAVRDLSASPSGSNYCCMISFLLLCTSYVQYDVRHHTHDIGHVKHPTAKQNHSGQPIKIIDLRMLLLGSWPEENDVSTAVRVRDDTAVVCGVLG